MSNWFDGDAGSCPDCGEKWEWVRPGKSQPTCECHLRCEEHGPGAIKFYTLENTPVPRVAGWFCAECWKGGA